MILPEPQDLPDDDDDIHTLPPPRQNVSPSAASGVIPHGGSSSNNNRFIHEQSIPRRGIRMSHWDGTDANMKRPKGPETRRRHGTSCPSLGRAAQEGSLRGALHNNPQFHHKIAALQTSLKSHNNERGVKIEGRWAGRSVAEMSNTLWYRLTSMRRGAPTVSHWAHCFAMLASLLAIIGTILCLRGGWW
jgi:hypothetical protein